MSDSPPMKTVLWCECTDCTARWDEELDETGTTIRCPECGSKNANVEEATPDAF